MYLDNVCKQNVLDDLLDVFDDVLDIRTLDNVIDNTL